MMTRNVCSAAYRTVSYKYMTYDELAVALRVTPAWASALALSSGWKRHTDQTGRARVSVPESLIEERFGPRTPGVESSTRQHIAFHHQNASTPSRR
jgi:hypothetical protein